MSETYRMTEVDLVTTYMLAGDATLTLDAGGDHFTYQIVKAKDADRWFVRYLTGPDNVGDYSYMVTMEYIKDHVAGKTVLATRFTKASAVNKDSYVYRWFERFVWYLNHSYLPGQLSVLRPNRCGRCHRELTTPKSIRTGLGPYCRKLLGVGV